MSAAVHRRFHPIDTSPEARAAQDDIYRRIGGAERVAILFRLNAMTRDLAIAGIRRRHPEYDDAHVRLALARLMFGDELARKAWPQREPVDP